MSKSLKAPKRFHVLLEGIAIGSLEQQQNHRFRLTYANDWLADEVSQIVLSVSPTRIKGP